MSLARNTVAVPINRNLSLDIYKVVLAFLVVGLHGNLFLDLDETLNYFFMQGFCRIAVPSFLIISGYYFSRINSLQEFIKHEKHLLLMYIIWMLLYAGFWFNYKTVRTNFIIVAITSYNHLWYLLNSLYAFVLLYAIRTFDIKWKILIFLLCATAGLYLQYGSNYGFLPLILHSYHAKWGIMLHRNWLFFCLPFLLLGNIMSEYSFSNHSKYLQLFLISSFGLLILEVGLNFTMQKKNFDVLASLYILCPVLFLKMLGLKYYSKNKKIVFYSTGVYLTHIFGLIFFSEYTNLDHLWVVVSAFVLSLILSAFLIQFRKWVPFLM